MNLTKIETNQKRNLYFSKTTNLPFEKDNSNLENELIILYPEIKYQEILGFGGALTESSAYCLSKLSEDQSEKLLKDYFSSDGICYNLSRLSIGSCDFSLGSYSYSQKPDLSDFSIEKDKKYILPILKKISFICHNLKLLASPWSPPKFMKTNHKLTHGGKLDKKYFYTYANYLIQYLLSYQKEGFPISYMTIQNEPNATQIWESCLYTAKEEAKFAKEYLFPLLQKFHLDTKLFIWDHNKERLYVRAKETLNSIPYSNCISGIAFHWYTGDHFENISITHEQFPSKLLFHTEGCCRICS